MAMPSITRCSRCDYYTTLGSPPNRRLVHIARKNGGYTHQWWTVRKKTNRPAKEVP